MKNTENYKLKLDSLYDVVNNFKSQGSGFYYQKPTIDEINLILNNLWLKIEINYELIQKSDCIVFDSAGIGDLVHSRLIIQHLNELYKNITWLVPAIIKPLYKDDDLTNVIDCCYIKYRNTNGLVERKLIELIDDILLFNFPNNKIYNIPYNVLKYCISGNSFVSHTDLWFKSNKIERNKNIKHKIIHNGKLEDLKLDLKSKYIVMEYCCLSSGGLNVQLCEKFITTINQLNIDVVYIGSLQDSFINNGIDCRGYSLYDTLILIKNSSGFLGRCSGNECLTAFHPKIPIFEVDAQAALIKEGYTDSNLIYSLNSGNFIKSLLLQYILFI